MNRRITSLLFAALVSSACSDPGEIETGGAQVDVTARGLTFADIASATLTISGPGIFPDIVVQLHNVGMFWSATVGGIPAGTNRSFHIDAYDAMGTLIFIGDANGVTVTPGQPVSVVIVLHQPVLPPPLQNIAPVIDALIASAVQVAPSGVVHFTVAAHDDNPGDVLTYAWTATDGSFSSTSNTMTDWTAPAYDSTPSITVTVTDSQGAAVSVARTIPVQGNFAQGVAMVNVDVNNWPEVQLLTATPARVDVSETTLVGVTASDLDGDPLDYAYSDSCGGSYAGTGASAIWTAPAIAPAGGTCTSSVLVTDGRGGSAAGTLVIEVGAPPATGLPPQLIATLRTADQATAGDTVFFEVQAYDPEGTLLAFNWTATDGVFAGRVDTAAASALEWTATSAFGFPVLIRATVTDAAGQELIVDFMIEDTGAAFYVRPDGDDAAAGTAAEPMRTIQAALDRAASDPSISVVRVALGTYAESLIVPDGTSIWGGFDPATWQVVPSALSIVTSPASVGVVVADYSGAGSISGLDVRAAAASAGGASSSRALVLDNVTGHLLVTGNRFEAGSGTAGAVGASGAPGVADCGNGGGGNCIFQFAGAWGGDGGPGSHGTSGYLPANQARGAMLFRDWRASEGVGGTPGSCGGGGGGGGGNLCCFGFCIATCGGNGGGGSSGGGGAAGGGGAGGSIGIVAIGAGGARIEDNLIVTQSGGDGGAGGNGGPGGGGWPGTDGQFCFAGSGGRGGHGGPGGSGGGGAGGAGGMSTGILEVSATSLESSGNTFMLGTPGAGGPGGFGGGSFAPSGEAGIQAEQIILF